MNVATNTKRLGFFGALFASAALLLALAAPALAAPAWNLDVNTNTNAAPGGTVAYHLQFTDITSDPADGTGGDPIVFTASLPSDITVKSFGVPFPPYGTFDWSEIGWNCTGDGPGAPPNFEGAHNISCAIADTTAPHSFILGSTAPARPVLIADVSGAASGTRESEFGLSGGGAAAVKTAEVTRISSTPPSFGIDSFDGSVSADASGAPYTQAAGHPYGLDNTIDYNSATSSRFGALWPVASPRQLQVDLPPGLVGNPTVAATCTSGQLGGFGEEGSCPAASQVGTVIVRLTGSSPSNFLGPFPVYNLVPPPDAPARLGFNAYGAVVALNVTLRSGSDYGLTAKAYALPEALAFTGSTFTLWGSPADDVHTPLRACPGQFPPEYVPLSEGAPATCSAETATVRPFLRNPTACTDEGLETSLRTDSWNDPGVFTEASYRSHSGPGYPFAPENWGPEVGIDGCAGVPFHPSLESSPTSSVADSPTGLDLHLRVPQECWNHPEEVCSSDLKDAEVKLPQGMALNPSAAGGLGSCSSSEVGLATPVGSTPIYFDTAPAHCPEAAKIGEVEIQTPLLSDPLEGAVYLAKQSDNPFGSLLAMYLVAEGQGIVVKQAGEIQTGPDGRLTTVFHEAPQVPFSDLHVSLFGGPRAPLRTPPACGDYAVQASLTPWSAPSSPVKVASVFEVTSCPSSGFDPKLAAGTQNPLAGKYSPFSLRLSREAGTQEIGSLAATLPPGLIGKPAGIPYCPDSALAAISGALGTGAAQEASPACPAQSRLGTVTVGAGAGVNPFYTSSGRAYLAGPYKGAPLSLAVVAPAVAGPFDLGSVVVRNALRIDPETTQVSAVSDPLPTILHGIPLDLRDVRVDLNRPDFTLNPTSCEPKSITSTITSTQGATANPSVHFQAANCDRLGFKPKLGLKLKGDTKRSGHPALTAVLQARKGDANIGRVQVALPHSEFLAQSHIRTVCTRVQFAAGSGGGAQCPKGSVYGKVTATSPLVDYPLTGNVYLRSSSHPLPDLVLALHGPASQPIEVDAVGRIDSKDGGIRTTFATVPDAPLTKVVLQLPGGQKSLLENSTNLCKAKNKASVQMDAHNAKVRDFNPVLKVKCGAKGKRRH